MVSQITTKHLNPYQPSVPFHIETYLFCSAKQITGFYMKYNNGLKLVEKASKHDRHKKATDKSHSIKAHDYNITGHIRYT